MEIKTVIVGSLDTNSYILIKNKEALVIDPGDDYDKIIDEIGDSKVVGVLITHNHFDHVGALPNFDKSLVYDFSNLEEKEYTIAGFNFEVIYTPGHTSDSVTYFFKEIDSLFCGDFVFYEGIGRCDLPTGNFNVMKDSINKIKKYPKNIKIYPGHDISTTLVHEIEHNIYFKEV